MSPRFAASCTRPRVISHLAGFQLRRHESTQAERQAENLNVGHSMFLSEGSKSAKWQDGSNPGNDGMDGLAGDYDSLSEGKGS